jgi:hypothetical protein
MVDLPDPEVPTMYVKSRDGRYNDTLSKTRRSGRAGYENDTYDEPLQDSEYIFKLNVANFGGLRGGVHMTWYHRAQQ